jgi:Rieske Fe-S protein
MTGEGRDMSEQTNPTRRAVVQTGIAAVAVTLAGCRPYGANAGAKATAPGSGAGGTNAGAFAKTADIPVGGGKIFETQSVVVAQPTAGQFVGFSAVCTHAGCTVASVSGGTINCACHGSKFHIADGSVAHGPAAQPLPAAKISVSQGQISLG